MQAGQRQQKSGSAQFTAAGRGAQVRQDTSHQTLLSPKSIPVLNAQAKLNIGKPGDKHEQEADRVADHVVSQSLQRTPSFEQGASNKPQLQRPPAITPVIQQQADESVREDNQFQEEEQVVQGMDMQFQDESVAEENDREIEIQQQTAGTFLQSKHVRAAAGRSRISGRPVSRAPPIQRKNRGGTATRAPPFMMQCLAVPQQNSPQLTIQLQRQVDEQGESSPVPFQEDAEVRPSPIQCRAPPIRARTAVSEDRLDHELRQSRGGGLPLPEETRIRMESAIGADFSNVRLHTDTRAAEMNAILGSQAFATGNNIYFASGKYDPENLEGQRLLAHELTHTVQQNASPRNQVNPASGPRGPPVQLSTEYDLQGGFVGDTLNRYARHIPGWELMTVIIGQNPLTGEDVTRTPQNFLRGFMGLVVGGTALYDKLNHNGLIDDAFSWLSGQLNELNLSWSRLRDALDAAWEDMDFYRWDLFDYNLRVLRRHLQPLWNDVQTFADRVIDKTVELVRTTMLTPLVDFIRQRTRAYPLLTVILGQDPVTGEEVERSLYTIVSVFLMLTESGEEYLNKLNESGKLQELSDWLDAEIDRLDISVETVTNVFTEAWELLDINAVLHPIDTFRRLYNIFSGPVTRLFRFVINVAMRVLGLIKDWLLGLLRQYANRIPGYPLLTVILGQDPLTGQEVPRTPENFIRGFLSFVPGGMEKFQNLQESGAIDKAFAWLEEAITSLGLIGDAFANAFRQMWETFSINDLTDPVGAFDRVVAIFTEPVQMLIDFAIEVGMKVLEFIFEGVLGPTGARVLAILKRARSAFTKIINDPVAFVGNLINAVKRGFRQFAGNILQHLQAGLIGWLTGTLGSAGITLPERFDFQGILSLVMQVLGITWQRVRQKLVRRLGERAVSILETSFEVVRILVTEGPAGLWEHLMQHLASLRDTVIDGIKDFIITRIVTAAVTRIATMLNPAGAVIQAIIAIYNTIMFFIERINQIIALVESVVNSISNIADGKINDAANYVEQTMARTLPVIISFLARLIGLGNVSGAIQRILRRVQRTIDRAIDRVLDWIVRQARRLIRAGRGAVAAVAGWFGRRVPFRSAEGRSHSLYFEGSDRNPQLKVRSVPTSVADIISSGRFDGNPLAGSQRVLLQVKYQSLRTEVNKASRGETVDEGVVQREMQAIKTILGHGAEDDMYHPRGTSSDPVLINWYKKESDYPQIFGASPTQGFERVVSPPNQSGTITIARRVSPSNFLSATAPTLALQSSRRASAEFFSQRELDLIGAAPTEAGNRRLPQVSGGPDVLGQPTEGTFQIDHVRDLVLGGPDRRNNLWPLSSALNAKGNFIQSQQVVTALEDDGSRRTVSLRSLSGSGKHVKAVSRSVLTAQNQAEITLIDRSDREFDASSSDDPYLIAWTKQASDYPTFLSPFEENTYRIGQSAPVTRTGERLQVSPEYFNPIASRSVWPLSPPQGRSTQQSVSTQITRLYREAERNSGQREPEVRGRGGELGRVDPSRYMEADHVRDFNFGGQNRQDNIWPLARNKNDAANAVNEQIVAYESSSGEKVKRSLRQARSAGVSHAKIVQVPGIPSNRGAHGTSNERPAGYAELLRMGTQQKSWSAGVNDRHEQEADRVADLVSSGNRQRASSAAGRISAVSSVAGRRALMQQKSDGKANATETDIRLSRSTGVPMEHSVRGRMEQNFSRDFSGVCIHNNSASDEMSSSIGARAFTAGSDIYFAKGQYAPQTSSGTHLLAHELTHVVQQDSGIRRQPVESSAARPQNAATENQGQDRKPLVLGSAPMPGLEPAMEDEVKSPEQVEQEAESEAGLAKEKMEQAPFAQDKDKGGKEKGKPGAVKAAENGKEKEEEASQKEKAGPRSVPLPAKGSDGMLQQVMNSPASKLAASYPTLGTGISEALKAEKKQEADSAPDLVASAGKGKVKARAPPDKEKGAQAQQAVIEEKEPKPVLQDTIAKHKNPAPPVKNATNNKALDQSPSGSWISWFKQRALSFMSSICTKDKGVNTSPGKSPKVELKGDADPERAQSQRQDGDRQTESQKDKVRARVMANPGKKRIQPAPVEQKNKVRIQAAVVEVETGKQDDMADYVHMPLPENVRKKADQDMAPLLEKSLAKPKADVKKASTKRKADKQAEVSKARAEVENLNHKADQDQQNIVAASRSDVAAEQKKGLDEADRQVKKYRKEADKEQKTLRDSVKKRVKEDEKKAAAKLKKAEQDAQKEKKKKEAEAAAKKRELKRKQKKKSWWDRVVDAVKSAVKALTKAIDGIFNALRKAVKFIIDTAKKAALALIELGRKFVVGLLNTFRTLLKSLVSNLIGKIFPELARKINKAIDTVVDKAIKGVNKVAKALKKGVEALANALGKVLDKILSVFQTALKAAVQIAGAVLTGDFAEAAKIAFYAACDIVGINPKSIMNFMEKAGESLGRIFKSPSTFFNNVAKGVKKGINQFVDKIKQHLLNGLIAWLTGAMGDVQITLPKKFDVKGVFSLVTQILGLTYDNIRAKVVKKLGPKGEKIVSTLEKSFVLVKELIAKGPVALWDRVKQGLSSLKEKVMEGIRNMVIEKVVKAGVVWLISMLNPASALVKAIKMLYDLVMFFVERWDQIVAFAKSIWNSVNALANGQIGAAANAVEQALARSIPVILGLLASLLGLGGIGKGVQKVIKKIRKPIDAAVNKVIDVIYRQGKRLLGKVTGKGGAQPPQKQTPQQREKNKKACEQEIRTIMARGITLGRFRSIIQKLKKKHQVRDIRMDNDFDVKVINSNPAEIKVAIAHEIGLDREGKLVEAKAAATGKHGEPKYGKVKPKEEFTFGTISSSADHPQSLKAVLEKELQKHGLSLEEIEFNKYFSGFPASPARPSRVSGTIYGYIAGKVGQKARTGTSAIVGRMGNREASFRKGSFRGGDGGYDGGHLISHSFGGPDAYYNLVPMKARVNRQVYGRIEKFMRNQVTVEPAALPLDKKKSNLDIRVAMNYGSGSYSINMEQFLKVASGGLKSEKGKLRAQQEENLAKKHKLEGIKKGLPKDPKKAQAVLERFRKARDAKKSKLEKLRKTEERDLLVWNLTNRSGLKKASATLRDRQQARAQVDQAGKLLDPIDDLVKGLRTADPGLNLINSLGQRKRSLSRLIGDYGRKYRKIPLHKEDLRLARQGELLRSHIEKLQQPRDLTRNLEKELARTPTVPKSEKEIDDKIKEYDTRIDRAISELAQTGQADKLKKLEKKIFSGGGSVSVQSRIPTSFSVDLDYEAVTGKGGSAMVKADSKGTRKEFRRADFENPAGVSKASYGTITVTNAPPETKLISEEKAPKREAAKKSGRKEEESEGKKGAHGTVKSPARFKTSFVISQA
ncbi:MAG: DUF4157 domain-containing protein [Desulfobulbaceae bacterium]|nr:DUF4157 domain-containing protein [Desulfobulbaceae bacterium]